MKDITRRGLLSAGAAGAVAGVLGQAPEAAAARRRRRRKRRRRKADLYGRARYARLRGRRFTLTGAAGTAVLTLVGVRDLPAGRAGDPHCFALTFRSSRTGPPQGTYTLKRRGFTPTTLFVVPSDARRRTYQVVVNRAP